jgi:hypothetical protein
MTERICLLGDYHSIPIAAEKMETHIARDLQENPDTLWWHLGDVVDAKLKDFPYHNDCVASVMEMRQEGLLSGVLKGNHDVDLCTAEDSPLDDRAKKFLMSLPYYVGLTPDIMIAHHLPFSRMDEHEF